MSAIEAVRRMLPRCAAAMLGMLTAVNEGAAQDIASASHMLPACKALVIGNVASGISQSDVGRCIGMVEGLNVAASSFHAFCPPAAATTTQRVRAIVAFIEAHPERKDEHYALLALDAMKQAWPCR
jgi:Ssp1 endopeptidase immunity protein Rap1a